MINDIINDRVAGENDNLGENFSMPTRHAGEMFRGPLNIAR